MRQQQSIPRRILDACARLARPPAPAPAPQTPHPYPTTHTPWITRPPTQQELIDLLDKVREIGLATGNTRPPIPQKTRKTPAPKPGARPPITATLRTRLTTCGKPGCTTCPHGPYLYATIRSPAHRSDVSLGPHPTSGTFYRRLSHLLPPTMIRDLIREWRNTL